MRWLIRVLISWALIAVSFWVTTKIISGIEVSGGVAGFLYVALVFGLVNAIIGPVLRILTFPLRILTLGLFSIVLNAFLLWLVSVGTQARWLPSPGTLTIDHFFWDAIFGAIVLGLVSWVLHLVFHGAAGKS
jgi:putative membrane protein